MKESSKELLRKQYEKLPDGLKKALMDANLPAQIQNIIKKHDLRIDQGGVIEDQTMLVLLGLEHPDNFVSGLVRSLAFPLEKVAAIAQDVSDQIFQPVKELLIHAYTDPNTVPEVVISEPPAVSQVPPTSVPTPTPVTPPVPQQPQPNIIAKTKLEQSFHIPTQTATVSLNQTPTTPAQPIKRREIDPYREPIQ